MPQGPRDHRQNDPIPGLVKRWMRSEKNRSDATRMEIERRHVLQARLAAEQARRRRATSLAKPRGEVYLRLGGRVEATVQQDMAVTLERSPATGCLVVAVEPIDPLALAGHVFEGFTVAIPDYRGPGDYDLAQMCADGDGVGIDPARCSLGLDSGPDSRWRWRPEPGRATVTIGDAEHAIEVQVVFCDPAGEAVELTASITRR